MTAHQDRRPLENALVVILDEDRAIIIAGGDGHGRGAEGDGALGRAADKHQGIGKKGQTEYATSGSGKGMTTSRCEQEGNY